VDGFWGRRGGATCFLAIARAILRLLVVKASTDDAVAVPMSLQYCGRNLYVYVVLPVTQHERFQAAWMCASLTLSCTELLQPSALAMLCWLCSSTTCKACYDQPAPNGLTICTLHANAIKQISVLCVLF